MTEETKTKEDVPGSNPGTVMVEKPRRQKSRQKKEQAEDESQDEQEELVEFAGTAIRAQRGGAFEALFSQMLASSVVVTDPLKRIKIVCEAAFTVKEESREELKVDFDRIDVLNQVANALLTPVVEHRKDFDLEAVSVPWPFSPTEESFNKFIHPWFTCTIHYWPTLMQKHCAWHVSRRDWSRPRIVIDKIIKEPMWSWFFNASSCLSPQGFNTMKNAFAAWATPQVQLYLAALTDRFTQSLQRSWASTETTRRKAMRKK